HYFQAARAIVARCCLASRPLLALRLAARCHVSIKPGLTNCRKVSVYSALVNSLVAFWAKPHSEPAIARGALSSEHLVHYLPAQSGPRPDCHNATGSILLIRNTNVKNLRRPRKFSIGKKVTQRRRGAKKSV